MLYVKYIDIAEIYCLYADIFKIVLLLCLYSYEYTIYGTYIYMYNNIPCAIIVPVEEQEDIKSAGCPQTWLNSIQIAQFDLK